MTGNGIKYAIIKSIVISIKSVNQLLTIGRCIQYYITVFIGYLTINKDLY